MARRSKNLATATRLAELFPRPAEQQNLERQDLKQQDLNEFLPDHSESAAGGPKRSVLRFQLSWAAAVVAILLVLLAFAGALWISSNSVGKTSALSEPGSVPSKGTMSESVGPDFAEGSGTGAPNTASGTKVMVHIAGAVAAPGVVGVAPGSRLFEALEAVGGALPEAALSAVNLAAVVQDGAQILIPSKAELAANPTLSGVETQTVPTPPGPEKAVNVNTATVEQLTLLPRIGPKTAQRIVDWRAANGRFRAIDELTAVEGIGLKTVESLRALLVL